MGRVVPCLLAVLAVACVAPAAAGAKAPPGAAAAREGVQTLKLRVGPVIIKPGQNDPVFDFNIPKPHVNGWIVGFRPNLVRRNGEIPRVDDLHLHHAVWAVDGELRFAAGEEKTQVYTPDGFAYRHEASDPWVLTHMIHALTPSADEVFITYEIDFIPDGSPAAAGLKEVRTQWLDVVGGGYPVFDVHKGAGGDGKYTFPTEARRLMRSGYGNHRWTVQEDGTLTGTAGHVHPGGLYTDLYLERGGRRTRLFRSDSKYWDPNGPVSWDMASEATPVDWRVGVKKGDVLEISATYETERASWYESMGIMPVQFAPGVEGPDPFTQPPPQQGAVTHGRLAENRHHGGEDVGLPDPLKLLGTPPAKRGVRIAGFGYGQGDLSSKGRAGRAPVIRSGQSLRFTNRDAKDGVLHTITSCKAPCNRLTGISYPLANGPARFDSGNLGFAQEGMRGFSPASGRDTWETPKRLEPGTYAYFCRVHPFMRGAFRVRR